jgi:hypothetical protein
LSTYQQPSRSLNRSSIALALAGVCLALSACGGGSGVAPQANGAAVAAPAAMPSDVVVSPTFHRLPVTLAEPADIIDHETAAISAPQVVAIPAELAGMDTTGLTEARIASFKGGATSGKLAPHAGAATSVVFNPAQIRAAYGMPALTAPANQLGAGQTIYIVDAFDHPNAYADLNAFNTKFGLPACTNVVVTALPLPAAGTACTFVKVYASASGTLTSAAPKYDAGWATEISMDVQWAHATAPLARIVLIEAADANSGSLMGAINLANAMGAGVVSMSFGANEGSWTPSVDSIFTTPGMTYAASTGDSGSLVSWPSVSPNVLAVGGTTLAYNGSAARTETAWSKTGGGISAYTAMPSYQTGFSVAGQPAAKMRAVADVSFNADPQTGQYVAVTPPGGAIQWYGAGGTSVSAPQWAGLIAVANAMRASSGLPALGLVQPLLYTKISSVFTSYSASFADVAAGSNGPCAACLSTGGYDTPTGLGTPNVSAMLPLLAANYSGPVVPGGALAGKVGVPLAAPLGVTGAGTLAYSLAGAPAGMTVSSAGVLTWATPVAGLYSITVTATGSPSSMGKGVYTLTVSPANRAPVVTGASLSATTTTPFTYQVAASDPDGDKLAYALTGAPAGLTISATGALSWTTPVKGSYSMVVTVTDPYGLKASATIALGVTAPNVAPVVGSATFGGNAGVALSTTVAASDANGDKLTFGLTGAPAGMVISATGVITWAAPVAGTYAVSVIAKDPGGLTGTGKITFVIAPPNRAPVLAAAALAGSTNAAFTAQVTATDPDGDVLTYTMTGAPAGLTISTAGKLAWAAPVKGTYALVITATDPKGLKASATFTLAITQPNAAPVITGVTLAPTATGAMTGKVTATDPNGDKLTFSMTGAPVGMTIDANTGAITWPKTAKGTFTITIVVKDPAGLSATAVLKLTIA